MERVAPKDAPTPKQRASVVRQADSRSQERAAREALAGEHCEHGRIAETNEPTETDDALAIARFIAGLRQRRELAGLSLGDVAERSGIDKAALSRLENGYCPNPTVNTLARYADGIGKRLKLSLAD